MGSPPAGRAYWNNKIKGDQGFVKAAKHYFQQETACFPETDYAFLSTAAERKAQGYEYAQKNSHSFPVEEINHLISFSMGAAFGEGMLAFFDEKGILFKSAYHLCPYQAPFIELTQNPQRFILDYQLKWDFVTHSPFLLLLKITQRGQIPGASLFIEDARKSPLFWYRLHRAPIFKNDCIWAFFGQQTKHHSSKN